MKRMLNAVMCMAAIVSVSCTKELESMGLKMIKVTFEDALTKSTIDDKKVLWEQKDAINIYDGTAQNAFLYDSETGKFEGTITANSTDFYAYYPQLMLAAANNAVSVAKTDESVTFTTFLPSYQTLRENSVSQGAMITACKPILEGDKLSGSMKTLNSFIKFTIADAEQSKIAKVRFAGLSGKGMSGRCNLVFDAEGVPSIAEGLENSYVECGPEVGEEFISNGSYYVSVLPFKHLGMTISLTTTDGNIYEYTYPGWVNLNTSNDVYDVGTIDAGIASGNGLTGKKSIIVDFTSAANITNLERGQTVEATIDEKYKVNVNGLYLTSYDHAIFPSGGYMQTPAIEDMVLTNVSVTFKGDSQNNQNKFQLEVLTAPSTKSYLTGYYRGTNSIDAGDSDKRHALPTLGYKGAKLYYSHYAVLGKKNGGENARTSYVQPVAGTSYYVCNNQGPALLCYIELIYTPVE